MYHIDDDNIRFTTALGKIEKDGDGPGLDKWWYRGSIVQSGKKIYETLNLHEEQQDAIDEVSDYYLQLDADKLPFEDIERDIKAVYDADKYYNDPAYYDPPVTFLDLVHKFASDDYYKYHYLAKSYLKRLTSTKFCEKLK